MKDGISEILQLEPADLLEYLYCNFSADIPQKIETVQELEQSSLLLAFFTNSYVFLSNASMLADIKTRSLRKKGAGKFEIDEAIAKKKILEKYSEMMQKSYNTVSRMITVKQSINEELHMSDAKYQNKKGGK